MVRFERGVLVQRKDDGYRSFRGSESISGGSNEVSCQAQMERGKFIRRRFKAEEGRKGRGSLGENPKPR